MKSVDLRELKVVCAQDVEAAVRGGATEALVRPDAIITPAARDVASSAQFSLQSGKAPAVGTSAGSQWDTLFHSAQAETAKAEIISVGRKLWQRQYVDGNGGNISIRLSADAVLCTPTLVSKVDLKPEELCLVDLDGNQLHGVRPRTSEILLHLEIYKAVPEAKAVVHCHPPHATAYAITGRVPPTCIIPEYEVFVGRVAVSPYETPGTQKFAETVLPYVRTHNTVLLANHGIVCWADTVTHAEWFAEVVETYCHTLLIASQLGAPISQISSEKAADLLAIKKRLGLPDARLGKESCDICDVGSPAGSISLPPPPGSGPASSPRGEEVESIIQAVTEAVLAALNKQIGGK